MITLNRPQARNSLSDQLTPALRQMIKLTGDDPEVGSILITGAGSAFCAGGDVKGMGGGAPKTDLTYDERVATLRIRQRTLTGALVGVRKPTIAALPGQRPAPVWRLHSPATSGSPRKSAIMTTGYSRIGLTGDYGIAWLLTRLAGTARARELMFLSERLDARRCEALGLVNRVVPDSDLRSTAYALARELAEGPSLAFGYIKDNLDHALSSGLLESLDQEAENLVRAAQTSDHKEAVRAFVEKRKPSFGGR
jgi:enoyl-CoA hydratase/carnithine racemase